MSTIIKRPRIEGADNGLIVCYEVYGENENSSSPSTYEGQCYIRDGKEVFQFDQQKEAMARFVELLKEAKIMKEPEAEAS